MANSTIECMNVSYKIVVQWLQGFFDIAKKWFDFKSNSKIQKRKINRINKK